MKKILELYEIENGYLLKHEKEKFRSFQCHDENDQTLDLLNTIIVKLGLKTKFRAVTDHEAVQVALSIGANDGSA